MYHLKDKTSVAMLDLDFAFVFTFKTEARVILFCVQLLFLLW